MAPAEIWQGGQVVNLIQGNNTHVGKLDGEEIVVEDSDPGCQLRRVDGKPLLTKSYLGNGVSVTLDGGEIVKAVRRK
jgi:hypothetical protein